MTFVVDFFSIDLGLYGLLACALVLFWFYSQSTYNFWQKLNIKYVKPIPIFGNTAKFVFRRVTYFQNIHRFYEAAGDEPYVGIYDLRTPALLIKDLHLVSAILIKDFKYFLNRASSPNVNDNKHVNPLSGHIGITENHRWKALRQKFITIFTSAKLKLIYDQIYDCADMLNKFVDKHEMNGADSADIEMVSLFERYSVNVMGCIAFGIDCNSLKSNDEFRFMCREVYRPRFSKTVRSIFVAVFGKRLTDLLGWSEVKKEVIEFFSNLLYDTIEYRRLNNLSRNDLLQFLMNLQNSYINPKFYVEISDKNLLKNELFSENDVAANAFFFFVSSFKTMSSVLSHCVYELANNGNIQQKLRSEVQQVREKYETLNYNSFKEMTYLDAVITETVRKYPNSGTLNRICTEDYIIPGTKTRLPAGTKIIVPTWSIHHDQRYYPNPEVYDPERFLNNTNKKSNGIFFGFGDGPRNCLGIRLAQIEMKTVLSDFILKYDFEPCKKTEIPLTYKGGSQMLIPACGIWVNVKKKST